MQERDAAVAVDVAAVALGDNFSPDLAVVELLELEVGTLTGVEGKPEAALETRRSALPRCNRLLAVPLGTALEALHAVDECVYVSMHRCGIFDGPILEGVDRAWMRSRNAVARACDLLVWRPRVEGAREPVDALAHHLLCVDSAVHYAVEVLALRGF